MLHRIPNILTVTRVLLIPILVLSFYLDGKIARYLATGIFVFASFTDYLDGFLARLLKVETSFGRMLDPVADKMLVISTLVMLVHKEMAPVFPIIAIICREILVSGLREYLGLIKVSIPVSNLAKVKTLMQMLSITILLLGKDSIDIPYISQVGEALLWAAAVLTLITGYIYCKHGYRHF